jgi:hypothetical protein
MTYVPKDTAELAIIQLTHLSSLSDAKEADDPMHTPLLPSTTHPTNSDNASRGTMPF